MTHSANRTWVLDAAEGGVAGGLVSLAIQMIGGMTMAGVEGFFAPVRRIAAVVLGARALDTSYSLSTALVVGVVVHLISSMCLAILFILIVQPWTHRSTHTVFTLAVLYGPVLWLTNIYVIAPALGWYWLPQQSHPLTQGLAHAFYGWRLGMALKAPVLSALSPDLDEPSHVKRI